MARRNEFWSIMNGLLFLLCMHIIAIFVIFALGWIFFGTKGDYSILFFWIYAGLGFSLIQLIYVIPMILRLKRQQRWGMMKGVIIGAVLTALLNGGCWFLYFR